ncbi:hypothetical protein [Anaerospora hongkongensis]|uniref:hypothetical protein n=1 Tax=Anaerospora hongkongensis TaxID=244830 RepID=UPI002FDB592E
MDDRYAIVNGEKVSFENIRQGQIFYLYEPDGDYVGKYMADSNAYLNCHGVWQVDCTSMAR